jgi:hypothetical protein
MQFHSTLRYSWVTLTLRRWTRLRFGRLDILDNLAMSALDHDVGRCSELTYSEGQKTTCSVKRRTRTKAVEHERALDLLARGTEGAVPAVLQRKGVSRRGAA